MYGRQQTRFGMGGSMPSGIKNLLYANAAVYLLLILNKNISDSIIDIFAFHPYDILTQFKIWQFVSYMFLHDTNGFMHIMFNMFALWMFGSELEREWGTKEFLKYYFLTGIGGAVFFLTFSLILSPELVYIPSGPHKMTMLGASGGVLGVLLAYALRFPDRELVIFPIMFPVKAKYVVIFYGAISFIGSMGAIGGGIAHAAHLGGMVVGFIYLKYWRQYYKIKTRFSDLFQKKSKDSMKYTKGGDKTNYYRQAIDKLLDKINRVGYINLTDEEKKLLEEGSKYLREHENENYH